MGAGDRTEKPTPRKVRTARKEGRIARTPDLAAWIGLLVASLLLPRTMKAAMATVYELFGHLPALVADPQPSTAMYLLGRGAWGAVLAVAPLAAGALVAGVAATVAQGGVHPTAKLLKPKLSRLNPATGIKRMLGPQSLWEGAKAVAKSAVVALILWHSVSATVKGLVAQGEMPLSAVLAAVTGALSALVRTAAITGLVIAGADYGVIRFRLMRSLRMSRQEVKEEHKATDGDPLLKSAIRSRQLAMSRNRMMADVGKADVVVVNPVHVAVALRYDPARGAPRIVAKGAGAVAAKIRERAHTHRVPMVENVPLARALYRACDLGHEIPPELYTAVAQVLAFVLNLRARGSSAGLHRPSQLVDEALNSLRLRPKRRRPGTARAASRMSPRTTTRQ